VNRLIITISNCFSLFVMSRSVWKSVNYLRNTDDFYQINKIKYTKCRNCVLSVKYLGYEIHIHNGKFFIPINFYNNAGLSKKLGEFSVTKKRCISSLKKKEKKKRK